MDEKNKNIHEHFSKTVSDYDPVADAVVMKNDELHEQIVKAVSFPRDQKLEILDLGSGTGHGMLLLLKKFPNAHITGLDFSSRMIEKALAKVGKEKDRVSFIRENFNDAYFPRQYDIIVSAVTLHNSSHDQKDAVFEKIATALKPGGVFVNGDFIEGESFEIDKQYRKIYRDYLEEHLSGEELKVWLHHAFEEDKPMKLSLQFELLKKHGLSKVQLLWQFNNQAVYIAKK